MVTAESAQCCGWCEGPLVEEAGQVRCLGGCPYQPEELPTGLARLTADLSGRDEGRP